MTQNDFEKALAALKALTHNDDETPMMIDMACWLIDHLDEVTAALQAAIAKPVEVEKVAVMARLDELTDMICGQCAIGGHTSLANMRIKVREACTEILVLVDSALQDSPVQNETGRDILDLMRETVIYTDHVEMPIRTYEAMKAALQQPAQGWMPIETAPKGELDALVIDVFGNIFHGLKGLNEKWSAENPAGGGDYYIRTGRITHWMPLPAAPDVGEVG